MRIRKSVVRLLSFSALLSALTLAGLSSVNVSAADFLYPGGRQLHFDTSYVTDLWQNSSGVWMPLTDSKDPNNGMAQGYVLPNQKGGRYAPSGGGAVGWEELGISKSVAMSAASNEADNQARKQAIYNLLYKKNTATSGADLDWNRMGSSLIVHQLLEGKPPKTGRGEAAKIIPSSSPMWADLKARLVDNDDVTVWLNDNYKIFEYNGKTSADADGNTIYLSNIVNTAGVKQNGAWAKPTKFDAVHVTYGNYDSSTEMTYVWEFRQKSTGDLLYALVLDCANPIGGLPGLPIIEDKEEYSLTPTLTNPAAGDVARGEKITAEGSVKNVGDAVNGKSWYITRLTYNAGNNPSNTAARNTNTTGSLCNEFDDDGCTSKSFSNNFTKDGSASGSMDEFTVPDSAAAGARYCFVVSVRNPTQVNDSPAWRHSAMNCVTVKREFALVPAVESVFGGLSDDSVVDPGESGTIQYSLENTGRDTSTAVEWRLTHYVYLPDSLAVPSVSQKAAKSSSTQGPCEAFPGTGQPLIRDECTADPPKGWTSPTTGITVQPGPSNKRSRATGVFTVPADAAVGTKYCWVASVSPPTMDSASGTWSHSDMLCIVVGKEPKIQVWGGDVRSGGGITTSMSTIQNKTYGSWVEYAALSKMQNIGLASGAGLNKGNSSNSQASWSTLTFANTGTAGCAFGCYSFALSAPTITGQFMSNATNKNLSGTVNINGEASGVYRATGGVSLSGTTISAGKTIIIDASGPVTILGSITYEDKEYRSARELPQLIIKAPTINIRNEASQVDAWLLAVIDDGSNPNNHKGVLNTCSNVSETADLTDRICNRALTVNGPVVADIVHLRRTAGSGSTEESRGDPAEIFNLRADAYMWASAYGSQTNQIHTVHSKELSPRF